jgi:hypothetical protein
VFPGPEHRGARTHAGDALTDVLRRGEPTPVPQAARPEPAAARLAPPRQQPFALNAQHQPCMTHSPSRGGSSDGGVRWRLAADPPLHVLLCTWLT